MSSTVTVQEFQEVCIDDLAKQTKHSRYVTPFRLLVSASKTLPNLMRSLT